MARDSSGMMNRRRKMDEPGLNYKLADMLSSNYGLNAVAQADVGRGKRIDILVTILARGSREIQVALEMEKDGTNKKSEAVKDAASRLVPRSLADLALAMVYPKSCQAGEDITPDTKLAYLHVTKEDIQKYTYDGRHDPRTHAKRSQWGEIAIKEISVFVSNLHKSAGSPEMIAKNLNDRLDAAVRRLGNDDMELLSRALKFNYDADSKKGEEKRQAMRNGSKRALLVVAGAALFHTQLNHLHNRKPKRHKGQWPPSPLDRCINSGRIRQELIKAWTLVLLIDYKPIFESAITVLETCTGQAFKEGIVSMAEWASETADHIGGLRHDILGRIFHKVLDTAKQDGSYYTSTPAAAFLATLAIPQGQKLSNYRVIDPACGTGTLLMASAERLADTASGFDPTKLIDDVIHGVDVNATACHMAATTLGLLSPKTNFDKMNIHAMEFGKTDADKYRAGSLEMYLSDGLLPFVEWSGSAGTQIDTGEKLKSMQGKFSLVIMNPPFTRNSLRHDQFTADDEAGVKEREERIFRNAPKGMRHSSDPMFMLLAEKLLKPGGTLAVVRPTSTISSTGSLEMRKFLAGNFDIETIVVSFDPERIWFSESTRISELLMVAKKRSARRKSGKPTIVAKLSSNPSTQAEATKCAEALNRRDTGIPNGHEQVWDQEYVKQGNWSALLFYSNMLVDLFNQIRSGDLFRVAAMGCVANNYVDTRGVRGLFKESSTPPPNSPYGLQNGRIKRARHRACTPLQTRT